jgi:hypothetical protein
MDLADLVKQKSIYNLFFTQITRISQYEKHINAKCHIITQNIRTLEQHHYSTFD